MPEGRHFRFEGRTAATSLLAGETKEYRIKDEADGLAFQCRTVGGSTTQPTVLRDFAGTEVSVLKARRRVLNTAYDLYPPGGGVALASYHLSFRLRRTWHMELADGRRLEVMDAETAARTILRDLLSGVPDVYLILDGEQQLAHVERTRRPTAPPPEAGGLLGRLRRTVAEALPIQDWTLLVDAPLTPDEKRVLIAATLLLLDHTIAGHQSV